MSEELVYHPSHYNTEGRKECWVEMEEKFGSGAVAIFDLLNAYKYMYRAGEKEGNPEEQDKKKIENYIHHSANILSLHDSKEPGITLARKIYKTMKEEIESE